MKKVLKDLSIVQFVKTISDVNNSKGHPNVDRWYYDSRKREGILILK